MKFLVFSVFLLLLLERGKGLKLKGDQKPDPPTITVDGYATADDSMVWNTNASMEIFGAGSNESVLVVPSAVRGLSLLCNASYPVEWTFHREKWNRRTTWQTAMVSGFEEKKFLGNFEDFLKIAIAGKYAWVGPRDAAS